VDYIELGREKYELTKAKLRLWFQLSSIQDTISKAVEHKDFTTLSSSIQSYVSTAFDVQVNDLPWEEVIDAFVANSNFNILDFEIPLLLTKTEKDTEVPWDYDGRNWFFWASVIAKEFGWSLDNIAELEVEEGIKLLQEILVDKQLDKEWEWMLSDRAFTYVPETKTYKFNPLERPEWMKISTKPVQRKIVVIPEHMLPVGNVISRDVMH